MLLSFAAPLFTKQRNITCQSVPSLSQSSGLQQNVRHCSVLISRNAVPQSLFRLPLAIHPLLCHWRLSGPMDLNWRKLLQGVNGRHELAPGTSGGIFGQKTIFIYLFYFAFYCSTVPGKVDTSLKSMTKMSRQVVSSASSLFQ